MCSTPFTCCSMGAATVSDTVLAFAPGYEVVMVTVGGAISGYWEMGRLKSASAPPMMVTIEMTAAKTGRSMKKRAIMVWPAEKERAWQKRSRRWQTERRWAPPQSQAAAAHRRKWAPPWDPLSRRAW